MKLSSFEIIGEENLQNIIKLFVERIYKDPIIGFFFQQIDQEQLTQKEFEFAANHLGGKIQYTGQPIQQAHAKHPINSGHFHRRLWILQKVLEEKKVEPHIIQEWLETNKKLEAQVTNGQHCVQETNSSPIGE